MRELELAIQLKFNLLLKQASEFTYSKGSRVNSKTPQHCSHYQTDRTRVQFLRAMVGPFLDSTMDRTLVAPSSPAALSWSRVVR